MLVIPVLEKQRQADLWGFLVSQRDLVSEPQVPAKDTVSQKQGELLLRTSTSG